MVCKMFLNKGAECGRAVFRRYHRLQGGKDPALLLYHLGGVAGDVGAVGLNLCDKLPDRGRRHQGAYLLNILPALHL